MSDVALTRPQHAARIRESAAKTIESIIETGRRLIEAKHDLQHGQFTAMVAEDLGWTRRTAAMHMAIARDARLTEGNHGSQLPPSWRTLYELTRLDDETFESVVPQLTPATTRKELRELAQDPVEALFHPVSLAFPMLSDGDLDLMAEDIRLMGLLEPILLHPDGRIIDGRCRWVACQRAGVRPTSRVWDGDGDLVDVVWALNFHRRHLTGPEVVGLAAQFEECAATNPEDAPALRLKWSLDVVRRQLSPLELESVTALRDQAQREAAGRSA